jgi:osmotically inducible protein OsmC
MAAAHAACYAMAFSNHLAGKDMPPERLTVSATYTFVPGTGITEARLDVKGTVPGLSADEFAAEAKEGESKCPVSNAVRGNVEITLNASAA